MSFAVIVIAVTVGLALGSSPQQASLDQQDGIQAVGVVLGPTPAAEAATPAAVAHQLPRADNQTAVRTAGDFPSIDAALAGPWRRYGCAVNPGNPACLTIGLAAECARNAKMPGCDVDRDSDRCTDVSEVLAGFDPFNGADCLSNRDGAPAINCLFPAGNLPCNAVPGLESPAPARSACDIGLDVERALHPRNPYDCATPTATPDPGCAFFDRDPTCDGFARRLY